MKPGHEAKTRTRAMKDLSERLDDCLSTGRFTLSEVDYALAKSAKTVNETERHLIDAIRRAN